MSILGWRHWAVDTDGLLRPAWTPWSPYPDDLLLWRPDGLTRARCLRTSEERTAETLFGFVPAAHSPAVGADGQDGRSGRDGYPDADGYGGRHGHARIPDPSCVCGLYAWRDAATLAAARVPRWTRRPIVVGVARLGGRVIVAEHGYRAERGYPVAVFDPEGVVSPRYPVARYRSWPALTAEWRPAEP